MDLEKQIKDWEALNQLFNDANHLDATKRRAFLALEVYPRLKEYATTYKIKYDPDIKPI